MKYKSKIDWWYYMITLIFSYCTLRVGYYFFSASTSKEHPLMLLSFLLCEFLFLLPNLLLTYYVFEEENLFVRAGYFSCRNIAYCDIVKLRDAKSLFSPGGLGLDRIEITYKYKDTINTVLISPKEKEEVERLLREKMSSQGVNALSAFLKQDNDNNNLPMNGIIK